MILKGEIRIWMIEQLQQENRILKANAEHNDKVVDKVNWENQLLKKENRQLKDNWNKLKEWFKDNIDKPNIKFILEFMERLEQEININKYIRK